MGLRLVNSFPSSADPIVPGGPLRLGLKSERNRVILGSLNVKFGLTSLAKGLVVPESDPILADRGMTVGYETTERRRPISGAAATSIVSGSLHIEKEDDLDRNLCVYELSFPIAQSASMLGYFKIRTSTSWTLFDPDWVDETDMSGVYLGLEHGGYNTALYTFLRNAGAGGSLVVGGPLPGLGDTRPGQQELTDFTWAGLADNTVVEIWIFFNNVGHVPPFDPPYLPVVEVWTKRAGLDEVPVIQAVIPVSDLGSFPSAGADNFRRLGGTPMGRLFIGNAGRTGDLLKVDDFALYPDFRYAVRDGISMPGTKMEFLPDAPVVYRATDKKLPRDLVIGRWSTEGIAPNDVLAYVSAQRAAVRHSTITKSTSGRMAYVKTEPRVEVASPVASSDGFMIEAYLAGLPEDYEGALFGGGISVDDGTNLFQVGMINSGTQFTHALLSVVASQTSIDGYYLPTEDVDFRTPQLVRLVVDRRRDKVSLYVDETKVLDRTLSTSTFPATEGDGGKVRFGHVFDSASTGQVSVRFVNYLSRYLAFEAEDGDLPTAAEVVFAANTANDGDGSSAIDGDVLRISKSTLDDGSYRYFSKDQKFEEVGGILVDFKVRVRSFTDANGTPFAPTSSTGAGLELYLGNKKLTLLFANCGIFGKKIAVIPGSGSIEDILTQTVLGKRFSAAVDWSVATSYRVVLRAGAAIEVWAGSIVDSPAISIPWGGFVDGFDLPLDSTDPAIAFGHFDADTTSESEWEYVRWGSSNGYEAALTPVFETLPSYLFGGRSLVMAEFEDGGPVPPTPGVCEVFEVDDVIDMYVGDVTLTSDAEVADFAGYDGISGDLQIMSGVTTLAPLESLRYLGGTLFLDSADDLASLEGLEALTTVVGSMRLLNAALGDVSALEHLHSVGGDLNLVSSGVTSLDDAFPCLSEVGLGLLLQSNGSLTSMVDAFAHLITVGADGASSGLYVLSNSVLTTAAGAFPLLTNIGSGSGTSPGLVIQSNTNLATMVGAFASLPDTPHLIFQSNPALSIMPLFPALTTVDGNVRLLDLAAIVAGVLPALESAGAGPGPEDSEFRIASSAITAFPTLAALTYVDGDVEIESNTGTFHLNGAFPALEAARSLSIKSNTGLTSATAMAPLMDFSGTVDDPEPSIEIHGNTALTTLAGSFNNVTLCNYLELYNNYALTNFTNCLTTWTTPFGSSSTYVEMYSNGAVALTGSFPLVTALDYVEIYGEAGLRDGVASLVNAFPALTELEYLEVFECDGLVSMAGAFPLLETVEFNTGTFDGYIRLRDLPDMTTMAGAFASLEHIKELEINNCDSLTEIDGFAALVEIDQILLITANAVLDDISTLFSLDGGSFDPSGAVVTITDNPMLGETSQVQALIDHLDGEGFTGTSTNTGNLSEGFPALPAPYLYWSMDTAEISGNVVLSLPSGSGFPAQYGGGAIGVGQPVAPVAGSLAGKNALAFDGTSPNGCLFLGSFLTLGTGDFTILYHVYIPAGTGFTMNFASWENTDGGHQLVVGSGPGGVNFTVGTSFANALGGANLGTAAATEGAWHDAGVVVRRAPTHTATAWLDGTVGSAPMDISTLAGLSFTFPNTSASRFRFGARVGSPTGAFADFYRPQRLAEVCVIKSALSNSDMELFHTLRLNDVSIKENQGY